MSITVIAISDETARKRMMNKLEYFRDIIIATGFHMDPIKYLSNAEKYPINTKGEPRNTHFNCVGSIEHRHNLFIELSITMDAAGNTQAWLKNSRYWLKSVSEYTWFTEVIGEDDAMSWMLEACPEIKRIK